MLITNHIKYAYIKIVGSLNRLKVYQLFGAVKFISSYKFNLKIVFQSYSQIYRYFLFHIRFVFLYVYSGSFAYDIDQQNTAPTRLGSR